MHDASKPHRKYRRETVLHALEAHGKIYTDEVLQQRPTNLEHTGHFGNCQTHRGDDFSHFTQQDTAKLTHGPIPAFVSFVHSKTAATEPTHRASATMDSKEMPAREVSYSVRLWSHRGRTTQYSRSAAKRREGQWRGSNIGHWGSTLGCKRLLGMHVTSIQ